MGRDGESEPASFSRFTRNGDPAAMLFHQTSGNGQAEAGSFAHPLGGGTRLMENIENRFVLVLGDSDARIGDGDLNEVLHWTSFDIDAASGRREFNRIAEQID